MKYGTPTSSKEAAKQQKILSMIKGVREFAWFPTTLADGTKIWLEYYWCYYRGLRQGHTGNVYFSLWSASPDSYSPYGPCYLERHGRPVMVSDYYSEDGSYVSAGTKEPILIDTE